MRGNFLPTCFGMPLSKLVKMHKFVRQLPVPVAKLIELDEHGGNDTGDEQLPILSIPKEVWMLTNYLYNHGLETVSPAYPRHDVVSVTQLFTVSQCYTR